MKGADSIVAVHRRYFEKFQYEHSLISCATNTDTNAAFGFWQDREVQRTPGQGAEGQESTTIAAMAKLVLNNDCSAIKDIYFLRQLHREEAEHKLRDFQAIAKGGIDAQRFISRPVTEGPSASPEKLAAVKKAAERFSNMWHTGDISDSAEFLEDDMRSVDLMSGGEKVGREEFCNMVKEAVAKMKPTHGSIDVGVSADVRFTNFHLFWHPSIWHREFGSPAVLFISSKFTVAVIFLQGTSAMVYWESSWKVPEKQDEMHSVYGLNYLEINPTTGKIKESAGFRQLSVMEREKVLKPDAFAHAAKEI